jgi:hypothetical protein
MSVSAHPIATVPDHPVRFDVEYPDRDLDRLTTFFRPSCSTRGSRSS